MCTKLSERLANILKGNDKRIAGDVIVITNREGSDIYIYAVSEQGRRVDLIHETKSAYKAYCFLLSGGYLREGGGEYVIN